MKFSGPFNFSTIDSKIKSCSKNILHKFGKVKKNDKTI